MIKGDTVTRRASQHPALEISLKLFRGFCGLVRLCALSLRDTTWLMALGTVFLIAFNPHGCSQFVHYLSAPDGAEKLAVWVRGVLFPLASGLAPILAVIRFRFETNTRF